MAFPDGSYDALVLGAEPDGDAVVIELTILAGEHKGEVVTIRASGMTMDPLDMLGIPATITVTDGEPSLALEP